MTWIVGAPSMFGYGIGISDVRVTLADGSERDCLQKIYPVGRFIAAGFAGSVRIGFAMLETLTALLQNEDETRAWDPLAVAEWWPEDARRVFAQFPEEQSGQSHLMLISTHPTEHSGNPDWPRAYVHTFKSPNFDAVCTPPGKVSAIGCGEWIEPCREAVESLCNDHEAMVSVMRGEQGIPGGMGTMLGTHLTFLLKRIQPRGISSHLHYCWVYRGKIIIRANDHTTFGPRWSSFEAGSGVNRELGVEQSTTREGGVDFRMPTLASTWDELVRMLNAQGATASGCVAR